MKPEKHEEDVVSLKCTAVVEEHGGWVKRISLFLDAGKAKQELGKKMSSLGLHYDQDTESWLNKEGKEVGYAEVKSWYSTHEGEIQDLKIDLTLLRQQIKAVLESNMEEDHKSGVHSMLGAILDACTTDGH